MCSSTETYTTIIYEQNYTFWKKIRPELWILMTLWGVIHGCHSRKQSGSKQFHTGSLVVLRVRDSLRNLCRALARDATHAAVGPYHVSGRAL